MMYKNFSKEILTAIDLVLQKEIKGPERPIAVFDADGTLWDTDIGENFFRWQIKHLNLNLPPNPWKFYWDLKNKPDPRPAYLWLAQINEGQSLSQVRKWALESLEEQKPLPIFEPQQKLIEYFQKAGVDIYVVTASVKWSVEPAAALFGIPENRVLGVSTKIIDGDRVSREQEGQITYHEGKISALLKATNGRSPFFGCGNTVGDISLLENATGIALAVCSVLPNQPDREELYSSEQILQAKAYAKNWKRHSFSL